MVGNLLERNAASNGLSPHGLLISMGSFPDVSHRFLFGFTTLSAPNEYTVCDLGSLQNYPAVAEPVKVSSTNANDTSNGTGARTVELRGLDANYNEVSETVVLSGHTVVNSVNSYIRIFGLRTITAGSGNQNAGDVYAGTGVVTTGFPATPYARMISGNNSTLTSVYTVPSGKTGYVVNLWASTTKSGSADITARFAYRLHNSNVIVTAAKAIFYQTSLTFPIVAPLRFPEKTDLGIRALPSADGPDISVSYQIILVDN